MACEPTLYHAVIGIAIPVLLVELVFPSGRNETWVGGWVKVRQSGNSTLSVE